LARFPGSRRIFLENVRLPVWRVRLWLG